MCPKNVKEMEKMSYEGKNGSEAERNRVLSKLFLTGNVRIYFHFFPHFLISIFKWLLKLTILSTESCLLLHLSSTGCL